MQTPSLLIILAALVSGAKAADHARALQDLVAQRTVFRNVGGVDCPNYPEFIVLRVRSHGPCQAWEQNCRPTDLTFSTWALHDENGGLRLPWGDIAYRTDQFAKHRFLVRPGLPNGQTHRTLNGCNPSEQIRRGTPCMRASQRETSTTGLYSIREWHQRGRLGIGDSGAMDFSMTFDAASGTLTHREVIFEEAVCRFVPDRSLSVSEDTLTPLRRP